MFTRMRTRDIISKRQTSKRCECPSVKTPWISFGNLPCKRFSALGTCASHAGQAMHACPACLWPWEEFSCAQSLQNYSSWLSDWKCVWKHGWKRLLTKHNSTTNRTKSKRRLDAMHLSAHKHVKSKGKKNQQNAAWNKIINNVNEISWTDTPRGYSPSVTVSVG